MKTTKHFVNIILFLTLIVGVFIPVKVNAQTSDIEYLEDGSYIVTELLESNGLARTSKSATLRFLKI